MQCVLIVAALLVSLAQAQQTPFVAYAGNTTGAVAPTGGSFNPPTFASGTGACSAAGFIADYQMFTMTVVTPSVYNFQVLFEQAFKTPSLVVLYMSPFAPATPCTGIVGGKPLGDQLQKSGGPTVNDFVFLAAGTYVGVITAKSAGAGGLFAINVFKSNQTGTITPANPLWQYPSQSSQGPTCSSGSSSTANYASATWTPATTAGYDIGIFFFNATYPSSSGTWYTSAAVFSGPVPWTGNATADPCLSTITNRVVAYSNSAFGLFIRNITLTAGQLYTIVFSGEDLDQFGYWGIDVFPSILHTTLGSSATNYIPPDRSTAPPCVAASNAQLYYVYTFTAAPNSYTYIFDTQEAFSSFDTFSYLYSGLNNAATGPSSCDSAGIKFLYGGDTGDQRPVAFPLNPGQQYTLIVTNYNQNANFGGTFSLYVMTGTQLGVIPAPPPGASTGEPVPSSAVPVTVSLASMIIFSLSLLFSVM